jgi:hypothetical protein
MVEKLSQAEIELAANSDILLAKYNLLKKISAQLATLGKVSETELNVKHSPSAKVSRGENYKNLPFLMLDYPRIFEKENIFAFRTLFWWGKFVSCTLHLKGSYLVNFEKKLTPLILKLKNKKVKIAIDGDEWNHDLFTPDYMKLESLNIQTLNLNKVSYVKVSCFLPIEKLDELEDFYDSSLNSLLKPLLND